MIDDNAGIDTGNDAGVDAGGQESLDTSVSQPQVIDIPDENALIRVKGSDKPVKYGEHIKGFQSQFTKASQRAAQLERELAVAKQQREQYERERQANQASNQTSNQGQDVFAALEALPYLDGKQAAAVVRAISSELQNRDRFFAGMANYVKQLEAKVSQLYDNHTSSSFDTRINGVLTNMGLGPEYKDIAQEVYLAYEPGPELDEAFPSLLKSRIEQIEGAIEARKRAAVERNRRTFVPGKGGAGGPSKPLQFKGTESANQIADELWAQMHGSDT